MAGLFSKLMVVHGRSRTTKPRPARRSIRFPAGANGAQAFGHDAQAWAKYQCQSHTRIFMGATDDASLREAHIFPIAISHYIRPESVQSCHMAYESTRTFPF
jgi:hypothetical protein